MNYVALLVFVLLILFHELGHYIDARRQGIYKGIIFNGLLAGIKLTDHYKYRWNYLGGLIYSFIPYPLALWMASSGIISTIWWYAYFYIAILLAIADILIFIFWKKSWKNHKFDILISNKTNRFIMKYLLQNFDSDGIIWVYR